MVMPLNCKTGKIRLIPTFLWIWVLEKASYITRETQKPALHWIQLIHLIVFVRTAGSSFSNFVAKFVTNSIWELNLQKYGLNHKEQLSNLACGSLVWGDIWWYFGVSFFYCHLLDILLNVLINSKLINRSLIYSSSSHSL